MSEAVPDLSVRLAATPEGIAVVRQLLSGFFDAIDWPEEQRSDVALAVSEACTNVVLHAYPDDAGDRDYEVRLWSSADRMRVAVRDFGRGIDSRTRSASAGLGLGLPLMLTLSDEVAFASGHDGSSTEVRMSFRREAGDGS